MLRELAKLIWPISRITQDELVLHLNDEKSKRGMLGWCKVDTNIILDENEELSDFEIENSVHINLSKFNEKYKKYSYTDEKLVKLLCDALSHEYLHYTISESAKKEIARVIAKERRNVMYSSERPVCLMHDHIPSFHDYDLDNLVLKSQGDVG